MIPRITVALRWSFVRVRSWPTPIFQCSNAETVWQLKLGGHSGLVISRHVREASSDNPECPH